jgi:hypothetical protein
MAKLKSYGWLYTAIDIQWYEPKARGFQHRKTRNVRRINRSGCCWQRIVSQWGKRRGVQSTGRLHARQETEASCSHQPLPPAGQRSGHHQTPALAAQTTRRAVWKCRPSLQAAVVAWIYADGTHHTGFSYSVTTEHIENLSEIIRVKVAIIGAERRLPAKLEVSRHEGARRRDS